MKLYVFYFSRVTKEVVRDEVEVEDKPKSYKTPAGYCLPYLNVSKFLKADTDTIYHDAYVSENGDFKKAVIAFRKYFAQKHRSTETRKPRWRSTTTFTEAALNILRRRVPLWFRKRWKA